MLPAGRSRRASAPPPRRSPGRLVRRSTGRPAPPDGGPSEPHQAPTPPRPAQPSAEWWLPAGRSGRSGRSRPGHRSAGGVNPPTRALSDGWSPSGASTDRSLRRRVGMTAGGGVGVMASRSSAVVTGVAICGIGGCGGEGGRGERMAKTTEGGVQVHGSATGALRVEAHPPPPVLPPPAPPPAWLDRSTGMCRTGRRRSSAGLRPRLTLCASNSSSCSYDKFNPDAASAAAPSE